jgi:poly-beta-hydroxyalkanoate depolymerase
MGNNPGARVRLPVMAGITVLLAGCSIHDVDNPFTVTTDANGKPLIWQCSLVKMATPAEYACSDGKTYMASQLREFRLSTNEPIITNK